MKLRHWGNVEIAPSSHSFVVCGEGRGGTACTVPVARIDNGILLVSGGYRDVQ